MKCGLPSLVKLFALRDSLVLLEFFVEARRFRDIVVKGGALKDGSLRGCGDFIEGAV
jgi:hypothetical protein